MFNTLLAAFPNPNPIRQQLRSSVLRTAELRGVHVPKDPKKRRNMSDEQVAQTVDRVNEQRSDYIAWVDEGFRRASPPGGGGGPPGDPPGGGGHPGGHHPGDDLDDDVIMEPGMANDILLHGHPGGGGPPGGHHPGDDLDDDVIMEPGMANDILLHGHPGGGNHPDDHLANDFRNAPPPPLHPPPGDLDYQDDPPPPPPPPAEVPRRPWLSRKRNIETEELAAQLQNDQNAWKYTRLDDQT